jgi:hypothetical protein
MKVERLKWQVMADLGNIVFRPEYIAGFVHAASCLARSQWAGSQNQISEVHSRSTAIFSFSIIDLQRK